jgi:hypothetical protein
MELRCGGRRPHGRSKLCRAALGQVVKEAGAWWVVLTETSGPRSSDEQMGTLHTPGRRRLDPGAELAAWCPRHRRQVVLDPAALIAAAEASKAELLLVPTPVRRHVEPDLSELPSPAEDRERDHAQALIDEYGLPDEPDEDRPPE